jgi:ATP-dependent Clp protease ATP-binding subunit ClpC
MFERFTEPARRVVVLAQDEARTLKHNYVGTEHLLLGLLREDEGPAARVLESLHITLAEVRRRVARIVGRGDTAPTGQIPFTPRATKVFELALREAQSFGHEHVGSEHILLGLVRENEGVAARILLDLGTDAETIRAELLRMLGATGPPRLAVDLVPGRRRSAAVSIPCQACGQTLEQPQLTRGNDGMFTAERSGAAQCRHCDARFDLSYRVEWRPA